MKQVHKNAQKPTQKAESKEYLERIISLNFNKKANIKSFDFSTLYNTIPCQKLTRRLQLPYETISLTKINMITTNTNIWY